MLQGGEIIIILLIALVVLGPTRLPDLARKAGRMASELRQAARDVTSGLEAEVQELREVRDELQGQVDDLKKPMRELKDEAKAADPRNYEWKGPKPVSGPTPEDAMRDFEEIERKKAEGSKEEESE
jgi:sec-independent protein translocase protein TatB